MPKGVKPLAKKKKPGRPKMNPVKHEARIEFVRSLFRQSRPRGEVLSLFRETFKINSPTTFAKYYRLACERNLETLNKSDDEHLAEAVAYWSQIVQEADQILRQCRQDDDGTIQELDGEPAIRIAGNHEVARKSHEVMNHEEATADEKANARKSLQMAQDRIDQNRKTVEATYKRSMDARRELDRILGMHATTRDKRKGRQPGKKTVAALTDRQLQIAMHRLGLQPLRLTPAE